MSITRRPAPAAIDGGSDRSTGSRRARGWRRVARGALVIAAGTAALALAGPMALRPFVDAAGAAGEVTVAFVLDFGPGNSQVVGCVSVPATDSRYDALSAFAIEKGLVPPTYAPSGLLCSIDLIPASGCGQSVAGGYVYWSYFTGIGGRWIYSSTGAFATVTKGDVEGWRFQDPGTGRPNDPGPRTAAVFTSVCSGGSPTTTTTTTTTTPTTAPPTTGGGSSGAGPQASAPVQTPAARVARMPTAAGGRDPAATAPRNGAATTTTTTGSTGSTVTSTTSLDFTAPTGLPADLATARGASSGPGTGPAPLIIGGLVILALAIAAWARWRARPRTP